MRYFKDQYIAKLTWSKNCHNWIWPEDEVFVVDDNGLADGEGDGEGKNCVYVSSLISKDEKLKKCIHMPLKCMSTINMRN